MALIGFKDVSVSFGGHPLLDQVNLQMERGERVCLLGRNGAGKSTLLRLIHGDMLPDDGEIVRQQGVRIAMLSQEVPRDLVGATVDIVSGGLESNPALACFGRCRQAPAGGKNPFAHESGSSGAV